MRVVVLGASGMLGHTVLRLLSEDKNIDLLGTVRSANSISTLPSTIQQKCLVLENIENDEALEQFFSRNKPSVIINCVGLVKQLDLANEPVSALTINSLLPNRLAIICKKFGARLIHISTDCVFSGSKGNYLEEDFPDANDLYGRSKLLGEVVSSNSITLRTSIIGHELHSSHGLVGWFLKQRGEIKGYSRAIFSGLPTCELARIIGDYVLIKPELSGLYHLSSSPISKYELLKLIKKAYKRDIKIKADEKLVIDRSLNSSKFQQDFSYRPRPWLELISNMHEFK